MKGLSSWEGRQQVAGLQLSLRWNTKFSLPSESLRTVSYSCFEAI